MTTNTQVEVDSSYIRKSISLFPEQDNAIIKLAAESGLENYSAALRMIINQWQRDRANEQAAQTQEVPS